ncbi:hypothetical protein [Micromonospora sp. NPDC051141]
MAGPDIRIDAALRRLRTEGFAFADEVDLPEKRAQLAFLRDAGNPTTGP